MFERLRVRLLQQPLLTEKQSILKELQSLLISAVRVPQPFLLGLSGGVDSSLLAAISSPASLVSVGVERSSDQHEAARLVRQMGWECTMKMLSKEQAYAVIKNVIALLRKKGVETDPINVGVGAVGYVLCQEAERQGIKTLMSGLGAEEIFGGYQMHVEWMKNNSSSFHEKCWDRLANIETRDIARDQAIAGEFNIALKVPFLDEQFVAYAMRIDPKLKVQGTERKRILRDLAVQCGVPYEFAFRKKVAAQYGSGFDKVIGRLAKEMKVKGKSKAIQRVE